MTTLIVAILTLTVTAVAPVGPQAGNPPSVYWVPPETPRVQYQIDCSIDLADSRLSGVETIRLTNTAQLPLRRLAMDWMTGEGRHVTISLGGKVVPTAPVGSLVEFDLPMPMPPGATVALRVEFSLQPGVKWDRPVTLQRWHPKLWWGFDNHADYVVRLKAPEGLVLATSGRRDEGSDIWRGNGIRVFGLYLARGMEAAEADAGGVQVRTLFTPAGAQCARLLLQTAVDAINFYRKRFGFYPYTSLTIVPGGMNPVGGFPIATSLVAIHGQEKLTDRPETFWRWITAHEIGHQYWLEHVLPRNPNDGFGWLMIGLGIFADREYSRAHGIAQEHADLAQRYTEAVRGGIDTTLARTAEQAGMVDFDFNNVATHGKGPLVISALASVVGRETFDRIYARCLREFRGRRLGAAEFQGICEQESRQSLDWFFDQWIGSNRHLMYGIVRTASDAEQGGYVTRVEVTRTGSLKMPMPLLARFADGSTERRLTDRLVDSQTVSFQSKAPLTEVIIDPDVAISFAEPAVEWTPQSTLSFMRTGALTGSGTSAMKVLESARRVGIADSNAWFRLGLMLYDGGHDAEALDAFTRAEQANREKPFAALTWQGMILDLLGKRDEALQRYRKALANDTGTAMQHLQYNLVIDRAWIEQRLVTAFKR